MGHFRYRLSWLLFLPVVLAVLVWWYKPSPLPAFSHFAEPIESAVDRNLYRIKPRFMHDLLVLHELKDCEYAVLVICSEWSTNDWLLESSILKTSDFYRNRIPLFICNVTNDDWQEIAQNFPEHLPEYQPSMKTQGFVGVVHRGKVIAKLSGPGECLTPEEYRQKIDDCLPWNYKL